jgi:hypothetical protein
MHRNKDLSLFDHLVGTDGKTVLTAMSTYTARPSSPPATLSVNGSIASSPVFVSFGGTLGGAAAVFVSVDRRSRLNNALSIGLLT